MTTKMRATGLVLVFCLGSVSWAVHAQTGKSREWLTWGGDIERTGWNRGEIDAVETERRQARPEMEDADRQGGVDRNRVGQLDADGAAGGAGRAHAAGIEDGRLYAVGVNTLAALDAATGALDLAPHDRQHRRAGARRTGFAPTRRRPRRSSTRRTASSICWRPTADCTALDIATGEGKLAAARIRDAVLPQLEPQSRRWRALHDRRTRLRQRSGPGAPAPPPGTSGAGAPPQADAAPAAAGRPAKVGPRVKARQPAKRLLAAVGAELRRRPLRRT